MRILLLSLSAALALPLHAQDPAPAAKGPAPAEKKPAVPTKSVSIEEAEKLMKDTPGLLVVDVRSSQEYEHEHIKGAVNIDVLSGDFESEIAKLDQTKPILLHCAAGRRSTMASDQLSEKGKFPVIYNMVDGFNGWKKAAKPFESKPLPKPDTRTLPGKK